MGLFRLTVEGTAYLGRQGMVAGTACGYGIRSVRLLVQVSADPESEKGEFWPFPAFSFFPLFSLAQD